MKHADRRLLWAPFIIAGVILAAWYLVWRAGANVMREALAEFAAAQTQTGAAFTYKPMRAKGFPFFLRGEIGAVTYSRGDWRWEADAVFLHAAPWALNRIVFSAGPSMRLGEPGGLWIIRAEGARASLEAAESGWLFKAEAASLDGARGGESVKTGRGVINVTPDLNSKGTYAVSFRLFDSNIANARGETKIARVDGALFLAPDARRISIKGLDVDAGPARATLSGDLAANADGFLEGKLSASISNPAALTETLRVLGAVKTEEARPLEAGLALIGAAGGGKIEAPLVFVEGETRLAGVKVGKAPKVGQP